MQLIKEDSEIQVLKTKSKISSFRFFRSIRLGYVEHLVIDCTDKFSSKANIKSFYFGFEYYSDAKKFAEYAKSKFPELDSFSTHCVIRDSERLTTPVEVKLRCLKPIESGLKALFEQCKLKEAQNGNTSTKP
jgi:hypothetical protein